MSDRHPQASPTGSGLRTRSAEYLPLAQGLNGEPLDPDTTSPMGDGAVDGATGSRWGTLEGAGRRFDWRENYGPLAPVTPYNPLDYDSGVTFDDIMAEITGPRPED